MSRTLLRKIQDAATDNTVDLPSLLRLCMVLASRLRNDTLKVWVAAELNGYESEDSVPEYRIFRVMSELTVHDPMQGTAKLQIPGSLIDELLGDMADRFHFARVTQSVAEIVSLVSAPGNDNVTTPWPQEAAHLVGPHVSAWTPVKARRIISRQRLAGILDVVRTRVLQMSLDLEETDPSLGEGAASEIPRPTEERIERIVYNNTFNITGEHAVVSAPITQSQTKVIAGDLNSLRAALQQLGLTSDEVEQTALAVQEEKNPKGVLARLGRVGGTLALKAAETGVAEVIKGFFA